MSKVRLVVKRRDNGKQVSAIKKVHNQLIAEHLDKNGNGGGIVPLALPQNPEDWSTFVSAKNKYEVTSVATREVDNPKHIFKDAIFLAVIDEWCKKSTANPYLLKIKGKSALIAAEHKKIVEKQDKRNIALECLISQHAPQLIFCVRSHQWWKAQFTYARKIQKKVRANKKS
jgi:hypothetical protein